MVKKERSEGRKDVWERKGWGRKGSEKAGSVGQTSKQEEWGWKVGRQEVWKRQVSGKNGGWKVGRQETGKKRGKNHEISGYL